MVPQKQKNAASSGWVRRWGNASTIAPSRDQHSWHAHQGTRITRSRDIQMHVYGHMWHGLAHSRTHSLPRHSEGYKCYRKLTVSDLFETDPRIGVFGFGSVLGMVFFTERRALPLAININLRTLENVLWTSGITPDVLSMMLHVTRRTEQDLERFACVRKRGIKTFCTWIQSVSAILLRLQ